MVPDDSLRLACSPTGIEDVERMSGVEDDRLGSVASCLSLGEVILVCLERFGSQKIGSL